jgi:hypothetical protein
MPNLMSGWGNGALDWTRTSKPLRALEPESSVFTNFTTRAGTEKIPDARLMAYRVDLRVILLAGAE